MKFYVVKSGHKTGIFENWDDCQKSVKGYPGADYKAFPSIEEAEAYLKDVDLYKENIKKAIENGFVVAFCDGSYDKDRNRYSYGVLIVDSNMQEHEICGSSKNTKYTSSQNIIGEVLGAINAMDWAFSNNYNKIRIYHDYEGLSKWISGEWVAKSPVAKMYMSIYKNKYADILQVEFEKVKGYSNNKYNDIADELAKRALSENARVPIKGDSWFSIQYFRAEELQTIIDLLAEEHPELSVEKTEKPNSFIYKLCLENKKLSVTLFNNGSKKLLVQGTNSILFQIFITYVYELLGFNADQIFSDAYRKNIDSRKVDNDVETLCPSLPANYPENIKRLIRQSIINLSYFVESEDYSQYIFPALRALEGHMKYLFSKAGVQITSQQGFCNFNKNLGTQKYILPPSIISDILLRNKLEEYYNFYNATRHTLFHFGDIYGSTDSTRIVETKPEADELIKKCLEYICEE
jgi:ribonuclease H-related protein